MGLLDHVKKSLLIPLNETYADDELNTYIEACLSLILSTGVNPEGINENPLTKSLVLIYCKTFFGFKSDGSVKELPRSFDLLLRQLALSGGGSHVSK
ncbi:MAG: head-tail connector protein [Acholeplasmataceae bacterium]|jgi:hypothetical protein